MAMDFSLRPPPTIHLADFLWGKSLNGHFHPETTRRDRGPGDVPRHRAGASSEPPAPRWIQRHKSMYEQNALQWC
eukprot:6391343-Alexandrium_andersonii.AAC.1